MSTMTALATANSYDGATVKDLTYAYANTSNTTYGNYRPVDSSSWLKYSGFDFSNIPDGSTINSVTYKVKLGRQDADITYSVSASVNNTEKATATYNTSSGTIVVTLTVNASTTAAELKAAAANNYFYFSQSTGSEYFLRVYGFEIIVDYTLSAPAKSIFFGMNF